MNKISNNTPRKFIESFNIDDWNIESDSGWVPITQIHKTILYTEWEIYTVDGSYLKCADNHIIFDEFYNEIYVKDCVPNITKIITKSGIELVSSIEELSTSSNMYDITVDSEDHRFYSGNILSHNSTLIEVLTFVLYGKTFRKINKSSLLNSINKSELVTEVLFYDGSIKYKVIRGIKPNIFEIYKNDVLISQDAKTKDYQEYLEKYILKTSYKSFTQVVILGSARYTPFMQLSAPDRRAIIEDLLDIQIFSNMNVVAKTKLSEIKESIQHCKYNIDLIKNQIELQKFNIAESKKSSDIIIVNKKEILRTNLSDIANTETAIQLVQNNNIELVNQISDKASVESKQFKYIAIDNKIDVNISKLTEENKFYEFHDDCPTCKQSIDLNFKDSIILSNNTKLKEFQEGKLKLKSELDTVKNKLIEISSINNVISNNNIEIAKLTSTISSIKKYLKVVAKELEDLQSNNSSIEDDNSKLQELSESLAIYLKEYEDIITEKSYYDFISLMLKDGGIKTNIIKQYLPILNKYINEYLKQLNFFVNFNINENFEEIIKSRHRDEFVYSNFSEGEKMRLDLAILFSFRQLAKIKNSVNMNLLILDEIMDSSLDEDGNNTFMELINTVDKQTNIFVISHNTEQNFDKFETQFLVEKVKNFSKIKKLN
jgi:DNA repair exonuclease SbcCD ATPase subunit